MKNIDQVNDFMKEIKQFGCKFYLDDFGSGYASYSYLKDLAVDCIKIDGVFIKDMLKEKSSHAMVKSITEDRPLHEQKSYCRVRRIGSADYRTTGDRRRLRPGLRCWYAPAIEHYSKNCSRLRLTRKPAG